MPDVSILVVDDDIASQRAMRNVLDAEGWRVRILPAASEVLSELARGVWNLVIVNAALTDPEGPVFAILKELALADLEAGAEDGAASADEAALDSSTEGNEEKARPVEEEPTPAPPPHRRIRVLFLIPAAIAKQVQPVIEREGLPYTIKPYNLHEFLEKVSDLLLEAGAIDSPIRTIRERFAARKRCAVRRPRRESWTGAMFASREDYQMTEEELAEWERQEEEDRKKRRKQQEHEHIG